MNSSQNEVRSTEQVILSARCSNWHYSGKWALIVFLFAGSAGMFLMDGSYFGGGGAAFLIRLAPLLCAAAVFFLIQLDRNRRVYQVTNKRVIMEWGILARSSNELRIQDIRSINVSKNGLPGMIGIGSVEFSSAARDDADVVFANIPDADRVRDTVRSLQS